MKWHQVDIKPVTVEDAPSYAFADDPEDRAIASLERQLANDEPKCANCKEWHPVHDGASLGSCKILVISGDDGAVVSPYTTTDLSVCSKWENLK
jgi:hypothetical protein